MFLPHQRGVQGVNSGLTLKRGAEHTPSAYGVQENLLDMASQFIQPDQTGQNLEPKIAASIDYLSFNQL